MKGIIIRIIWVLVLLPVFGQVSVFAQETEASEVDTTGMIDFTLFTPTDPFITDTPLVINLEFDIKEFVKTRQQGEYMQAILSYTDHQGIFIQKEVRIRARGDFRLEHCTFPPIKLNLMKEKTSDESLNDLNSVKLVTHCKNSKTYEQYLLKEFLIYRMYNLFSDYSYRVRLIVINYIDSQANARMHTHYGFIIECDKHLADRINAVEIERMNMASNMTDYNLFQLLSVFQFMVGNTDWSVPALHNIKLYKPLDIKKVYPVAIPYDFDYSGMVNAYYAIPDEKLGIKSVRERIYRGYCIPVEDYVPVFQKFIEKKDALYALVTNSDFLINKNKQEMTAYLDEFYHILENPRMRDIMIIKSCRELNIDK